MVESATAVAADIVCAANAIYYLGFDDVDGGERLAVGGQAEQLLIIGRYDEAWRGVAAVALELEAFISEAMGAADAEGIGDVDVPALVEAARRRRLLCRRKAGEEKHGG